MGMLSVVQTLIIPLVGMKCLHNPQLQAWVPLTQDQIQTAVFLQLVAGGHLLLFVVRTRRPFFTRPWPAKPLFLAVVGTQVLAVLMCGLGWFVTALPWTVIGLLWACWSGWWCSTW